ncbi:MAG TPA: hypothetical protein VL200_05565 [Lacunisphaera sp.]|jgi:hypothetical protein|nr:hypothetical protein [Lacunisphaera sp.]
MRITIICFVLVLAAARLAATEAPANPPDTDYSKVVFENDRVRIIHYHTATGKNLCGFGMHTHPPHAYIQIQPAKFRVTTPEGKEEILDSPAGDVGWEPAVTHRVESLSPVACDTYLVEVKDKDWKPSTGLHL